MTVHVLPDVEQMAVAWALATEPVASLVDDRIYTAIPKDATFPLVRVTRVGGSPTSRLLWQDQALLQWDVFGGPKQTARLVAETTRAHLGDAFVAGHALGTVTAVEFGDFVWLPDESYVPAKPRYTFDTRITYHP